MMAERGVNVDHSTIHRWVAHFSPALMKHFNCRKRSVSGKCHMDETYIKVRGGWMYLYGAIDSVGDTAEFWFSENRDLPAAKRFLRKALARHGRPERIVIDGSQTNREAIASCDAENRLPDRWDYQEFRVGAADWFISGHSLDEAFAENDGHLRLRHGPLRSGIFHSFSDLFKTR